MAEKIETILDYNPTEEEWKRFGGKELFLERQYWLKNILMMLNGNWDCCFP